MGHRGWGLGRYERGRYRKSVIDRVHGVIELTGHWRPPVLMIERLMGLPDGWLRPPETPVVPAVAAVIGRLIIDHLAGRTEAAS
jgi:hypothetical protein